MTVFCIPFIGICVNLYSYVIIVHVQYCEINILFSPFKWQTKNAADDISFYLYLSEKIRLDVSCEIYGTREGTCEFFFNLFRRLHMLFERLNILFAQLIILFERHN